MKERCILSKSVIVLVALVWVVSAWQPAFGDGPAPAENGLPSISTAKGDAWVERAEERNIVSAGAPVEPLGSGGPDQYGYTWTDTGTYTWLDAASDTMMDSDDLVVGPVPIGFAFPFYEHSETQIYISSNGLLLFGSHDISFNNRSIPFVGLPNSFIAPFWDDLDVDRLNGGRVSYQAFADKFVVAWKNITRHGAPDLLSFEAILYNNGNICFQYQELNGTLDSATIGQEDPDGIDGLLYLHNAPGIAALEGTRSLCFTRPAAHYETKILPTYQGQFSQNNIASFPIEISNIGGLGADTFDLTTQSSDPSWTYAFYSESLIPLKDTNGNGRPDTGSISAGSSMSIVVRAIAPAGASVGANTMLILTATSSHDANQKREVQLQAAVPTAYGQAVKNSESGVDLDLIWPHDQRAVTLAQLFTGSNLAVATLLDNGYMYLWERNGEKTIGNQKVKYTDIEYSLLSQAGIIEESAEKLTSNYDGTTQTMEIADTAPTLAVNSSGLVGITWKRDLLLHTDTLLFQSNIYFLIFDLAHLDHPVVFQTNVTQNSVETSSPRFDRPKIKAASDGRFILTWEDKLAQSGVKDCNISMAIYAANGSQVFSPAHITTSTPGHILYQEPGMAELSGNKVLVTYSKYNADTDLSTPSYQVINSSGGILLQGSIPTVNGWLGTAAELGNGKILMAWTQAVGGTAAYDTQIAYTLLDGSSYAPSAVTIIPTPNERMADFVSVSIDGNGYGIITWIDVDLNQGLYYALINENGTLRTEPISFEPVGLRSALVINNSGYSLASYQGSYLAFMPTVVKK